jgi:hypothetical protein
MKQITCPHCADTYPDFDVAHVCSKGPYAPRLKPKMNEQIRELAEQARAQYCDLGDASCFKRLGLVEEVVFTPEDLEKFAELIVRECMKLNSKELSITAIERLLPLYEEHFGVEE